MEELFQYARAFLAIGIIQIFILIGIFVGTVVITNNTASEEKTENKCDDVRLAYCFGCITSPRRCEWFTTGKTYIVSGKSIVDDQGYKWDTFYTVSKKPHIVRMSGYQFYVI